MIGTELVRELVESVILSGKIKGADPCSLLLIAAPESGKTSIVLDKSCKSVEAFADVTGKGIHAIIKQNKELTHIVINDMVGVLSHRASVNKYTISVLNALTEEGINQIASPAGIEQFDYGRKGIIASITTEMAKDARYWWNKIGFASRMHPFHYAYSEDLIIKIKDKIQESRGLNFRNSKREEFRVPKHSAGVEIEPQFAQEIRYIAEIRARDLREQGMRRLKQYLVLTQGHALLRMGPIRTSVNSEDIEFLKEIDMFVSYEKPRELTFTPPAMSVTA